VLTKIDIMDPGTNCRDILDGMSYQLRNGWIGVVNRGQADINSRVRGRWGPSGRLVAGPMVMAVSIMPAQDVSQTLRGCSVFGSGQQPAPRCT
jgi:hypothetical protein